MDLSLENKFARRMNGVPRSFIREILKIAISPDIISFAGGLPNKEFFPMEELKMSALKLMSGTDRNIFQYANTEGYLPLRKKISERYAQKGIKVNPENILITNGSQQGLDLLGKVFINERDKILIEEPGYLGAIQAFSIFKPEFTTVPLRENGIDTMLFKDKLDREKPKLAYLIPNFQNPSGISYDENTRLKIAESCKGKPMFLIEDDPYGDIRFNGQPKHSFYHYLPEQTILLGTFSKTVVPAFRMGWIVAPDDVMDKLIIAKQAADLHTDYFTQRLIDQYLSDFDINTHINQICEVYGRQANAMLKAIKTYFPENVKYTTPEGGMFLWITLPTHLDALTVFELAIKQKVAFVPGNPFYVDKENVNTLRLNFSCSEEAEIEEGIKRLGHVLKKLC